MTTHARIGNSVHIGTLGITVGGEARRNLSLFSGRDRLEEGLPSFVLIPIRSQYDTTTVLDSFV